MQKSIRNIDLKIAFFGFRNAFIILLIHEIHRSNERFFWITIVTVVHSSIHTASTTLTIELILSNLILFNYTFIIIRLYRGM